MSLSSIQSFVDLQALNLEKLENLWDEVPTEYQEYIQRRYTQALKSKRVADDQAELQLISSYLKRYESDGLIPAGENWVKLTPSAKSSFQLNNLPSDKANNNSRSRRNPLIASVVGIGVLLMVLLIPGVMARQSNPISNTLTPTPTSTLTPTSTIIPTATPLALIDTDRFVEDSDKRRNRSYFPVVFRVVPKIGPPRVFVVQERLVNTTEWNIDPNPDVASWVSGMAIHPVIGIPFSKANHDLFNLLTTGDELILRMNTGIELRFIVESLINVPRDYTAIFSQQSPGIAIVLVGEVDEAGLPTEIRRVVLGRYVVAQELDWLNETFQSTAQGTSAHIDNGLILTITDTVITPLDDLTQQIVVSIRLEPASEESPLSEIVFSLEDSNGIQYPLSANSSSFATSEALSQPIVHTITAQIPANVTALNLLAMPSSGTDRVTFELAIPTTNQSVTGANLDLQLRNFWRDSVSVAIEVRLYNPTSHPISLRYEDIWVVSGYVPNPDGPHRASFTFEPMTISPDEVLDVVWRFNWNGSDPYARVGVLGREYAITLVPQA